MTENPIPEQQLELARQRRHQELALRDAAVTRLRELLKPYIKAVALSGFPAREFHRLTFSNPIDFHGQSIYEEHQLVHKWRYHDPRLHLFGFDDEDYERSLYSIPLLSPARESEELDQLSEAIFVAIHDLHFAQHHLDNAMEHFTELERRHNQWIDFHGEE